MQKREDLWIAKENEQREHPLLEMENAIKQRGIVVIDNVTSMPHKHGSNTCQHMVVSVCHQGKLEALYDDKPITFEKSQASVVFPHHQISVISCTDDYRASLLVISADVFAQMRHRSSYLHQQAYRRLPGFTLNPQQYAQTLEVFSLLRSISQSEIAKRELILASLIDILSILFDAYRFTSTDLRDFDDSPETLLFSRYYELITQHHHETREVGYYARYFNLSPKYFSTLIKRETGMAAGEWISQYIIVEAKNLLRNRLDLNVQQIALKLGFHDQAAFSRYFRTNAGMAPRQYREQYL